MEGGRVKKGQLAVREGLVSMKSPWLVYRWPYEMFRGFVGASRVQRYVLEYGEAGSESDVGVQDHRHERVYRGG